LADEILRIDKGEMKAMSSRSFREGFLGKTLEDGLQVLIENYPEIIPGRQIAPGSEDPPRFLMLCREMIVGSWSLDFLLVDQHGILTLVEAKLVENPESRRAVIGQIAEYAANAADNWRGGKLVERAMSYYAKKGANLEESIKSLIGRSDVTIDEFFGQVENNLIQGKMRLIIVTDQLRPEVRKIIEYLNSETRNIEILGLEIGFFGGDDEESFVLVPTIVGQSQVISDKKRVQVESVTWAYPALEDAFGEINNRVLAERLLKIASWSNSKGVFIPSKGQTPSFGIRGKYGRRVLTFSSWGIYCYLNARSHGDNTVYRDIFVDSLRELPIFEFTDQDVNEAKEGRNSTDNLDVLTEQEFLRLIEILNNTIVDSA
jgi:hypothetical protein